MVESFTNNNGVNLMETNTCKCPNCGAPLEFKTDTQSWTCEYCLSNFNEDEVKSLFDNQELGNENEHTQQHQKMNENDTKSTEKANIYKCTNCGAQVITGETTSATFCCYCHSPIILSEQLLGGYHPAKIIPFKFNREEAVNSFNKWCLKKPLLPIGFCTNSQLEKLSGIYVPFWLFDCHVRGNMSAVAEKVSTWKSGDRKYTQTDYYNVYRKAEATFTGIPADGLTIMDDDMMEILEPYDYSDMKDFSMAYLSGYYAERYDVDEKEVQDRIEDRINKYTLELLRNTIEGYSSVTENDDGNVDIYKSEVTYVLLPVWILTYNYKDKIYMYAMNGQTGKIAGDLPISIWIALFFFALFSAAILLLMGVMFLC